MKPTCFGSYHPNRRSPCAQCKCRARCAGETTFHAGFSSLPHPRFSERSDTLLVADPETDGERLARAVSRLVEAGFRVKGNHALIGTKTRFAKLCLLYGRLSAKVYHIPVKRVLEIDKSDLFDIKTWREKEIAGHTRWRVRGSLVVASSAKALAYFLRELAISIKRESE